MRDSVDCLLEIAGNFKNDSYEMEDMITNLKD